MNRIALLRGICLSIALVATMPGRAADQSASAPKNAPSMEQKMQEMKKSEGPGKDMQQMMAHCAEMREQMKQGKPMSADMHKMMQGCDRMDAQMPMPSGTKDR